MTFLTSPHCWLDSLATLPDSDVSDLCSEVHLVSREGDTISIPTVVLLATSNLLRQLISLDEGKEFGFSLRGLNLSLFSFREAADIP